MSRSRLLVLLLAPALTASLFIAAGAAGQVVHGTVRDRDTGQPVPGAVVWLSDSAGVLLARALDDSAGRFNLPRLPASARLHVLHIGFHPVELPLEQGAAAVADTLFDVRMSSLPLALSAVQATSRRVCPGDKGTSSALDLWEQARAALLAGVVARESAPPRLRVVSYVRSMEPIARTMLLQTISANDIVGDRSYVAARSAWAFAQDGYMSEDHSGARQYYAPDDRVLIDPSFAGTHCMHVVRGTGLHDGEIGIGFEPLLEHGRDTLVDVSGVLWLDSVSTALRSLDFKYTGLEPIAHAAGGEISFTTMPNGAPLIDHWELRFPVLAEDIPLNPDPFHHRKPARYLRRDMSVREYREVGGAIAVATWPNGVSWHSPLVTSVLGQLVTLNGKPAPGVRVWLHDGPDTTTTDAHGDFAFANVLPGSYSLKAADSTLARVGFSRVWAEVKTHAGASPARPLYFYYSNDEVLKLACAGQPGPPGTSVLLGRVMSETGDPVPSAHVEVRWDEPSGGPSTHSQPAWSADVDDDGRFAVCGVPSDMVLHLSATSDAGRAKADATTSGRLATVVIVIP